MAMSSGCCLLSVIVEGFGCGIVVCGLVQETLIGNWSVIFMISCCSRDWRVDA